MTQNPDINHGKSCVWGLRYPVGFLLELLSPGMIQQEILQDDPDLELFGLQDALLLVLAAHLAQLFLGAVIDHPQRLDLLLVARGCR